MGKCCVQTCNGEGIFHFPKDKKRKRLWEKAIGPNFQSSKFSRLCCQHFSEKEVIKNRESYSTGLISSKRFLKPDAIPSLMLSLDDKVSKESTKIRKYLFDDVDVPFQECPLSDSVMNSSVETIFDQTQTMLVEPNKHATFPLSKVFQTVGTQLGPGCLSLPTISHRDDVIHYYTGLKTYAKFSFAFSIVNPYIKKIRYINQVKWVTPESMMFLTLMKLRKNKPNFELGLFFGISESVVLNIFHTWIYFLTQIWSLLDTWPCKEIVSNYMPANFKQIIQETNLQKCQLSDSEITEQDTNVQDICVIDQVAVNVSNLQNVNQCLSGMVVLSDNKVASQNEIEKLICLSKQYEILQVPLNTCYANIATEIFSVCIMLCNFSECNLSVKC